MAIPDPLRIVVVIRGGCLESVHISPSPDELGRSVDVDLLDWDNVNDGEGETEREAREKVERAHRLEEELADMEEVY